MSVSTFTSGSGNWVADDTAADIELWAGGGAGAQSAAGVGGGGGGGGEYLIVHVTGLTFGNSYAYAVGGSNTDTTFIIGGTTYRAHHGTAASGSTGGAGGTGGNGDTNRNGGNGGTNTGAAGTGGAGGGSSAGTAAAGNNGSANSAGLGGAGGAAVTDGGAGGVGGTTGGGGTNGTVGSAPGGGGGGAAPPSTVAGAGATGQVRVTTNPAAATNCNLTLSTRRSPISFENTLQQGFSMDMTLSTGKSISPSMGLGAPMNLDMTLSKPLPTTNFALTIEGGTRLDMTLSTRDRISFSLQFATVLSMTLSVRRPANFPMTLVWGAELAMTLSTRQRINPSLAFLYGVQLVMSLSTRPRTSGALFAWISNPSATKYIQAHRSGVTQIIFGVDVGQPFLLNKAATGYRRRAKHQLIHTGKVKPIVEEINGVFTILTPTGDLQPGEFLYEAPGGYLRIRNDAVIFAMLTQDGDTPNIPILQMKVDITKSLFLTGFHQDGEIL